MSADTQAKVSSLKSEGNACLSSGDIDKAVSLYSEAIKLEPENHVLYSNRSAAYCKGNKYEEALTDAIKVISIKPDWAKGYSRKGSALSFMSRDTEALECYEEGLAIDPNSEILKNAANDVRTLLKPRSNNQNPFNSPEAFAKLSMNPKTATYMADPVFRNTLSQMTQNKDNIGMYLKDPRIMECLGVLMNFDLSATGDASAPSPNESETPLASEATTKKTQPPPTKKPEPMDVDLSDNQNDAMKCKEKGNESYKKKEFEDALKHYGAAIELEPDNVTFRNNRAAVYFEQKEYEKCIEEAKEAVEIGREHQANYLLIAKSLSRIGNAYSKLEDYQQAIAYFNKSLAEKRDKELEKKIQSLTKKLKDEEKLKYIDPELAAEEKQKGNDAFKQGKYPDAVKFYSEAIKRNPNDSKLFSNRAACYTKLTEFPMALADCERCILIEPTFVKGHLRKASNLLAMKEYARAQSAYEKCLELDSNCQEALDGYRKCNQSLDSDPDKVRERAMKDPEVQKILADPAMQMILQQMQNDPSAVQEHLSNPEVATKIRKLMQSGIISMR